MKRTLFILLLCLAGAAAHAEKADSNQRTVINAKSINIDDVNQMKVLTGDVELHRGTLVMHAEKATLKESPEGWQLVTLFGVEGKPATFRQKRDGGGDLWVAGQAQRIEYDEKTALVKLFTKANVQQLEGPKVTDQLDSDFISYDSRKEQFVAHNEAGAPTKSGDGRITLIMEPRQTKPAPAASTPPQGKQ